MYANLANLAHCDNYGQQYNLKAAWEKKKLLEEGRTHRIRVDGKLVDVPLTFGECIYQMENTTRSWHKCDYFAGRLYTFEKVIDGLSDILSATSVAEVIAKTCTWPAKWSESTSSKDFQSFHRRCMEQFLVTGKLPTGTLEAYNVLVLKI